MYSKRLFTTYLFISVSSLGSHNAILYVITRQCIMLTLKLKIINYSVEH